jgi:predicted nucleotidyltransferase component of viral defense system
VWFAASALTIDLRMHPGIDMSKDNNGAAMASRLKSLAKETKADARVLLIRFAQERFLHRLQAGPYKDRFVLKGGMLFMCRNGKSQRPTEDIDLHDMDACDVETIADSIKAAASIDLNDGVTFDLGSVSSVRIREGSRPGTRVTMSAGIGSSIVRIKLDICSGDALTPSHVIRNLPSALPKIFEPVAMPSYAWETVIAEKVHAMQTFGLDSTRMKDWYDIATIAQEEVIEGGIVVEAITRTFAMRKTEIDADPVSLSDKFIARKSPEFARWVKHIGAPEERETLTRVIETARGFLFPILDAAADGTSFDSTWDPERGWSEAPSLRP